MLRRRAILSLTARKDPVKNKVKWPLFCSPQERCLGILVSHRVRCFRTSGQWVAVACVRGMRSETSSALKMLVEKTSHNDGLHLSSAVCRRVSSLCFTCRWEISLIWAAKRLPQSIQKTVGAEASGKKLHIFEHLNTIHVLLQWK